MTEPNPTPIPPKPIPAKADGLDRRPVWDLEEPQIDPADWAELGRLLDELLPLDGAL